MIPDMKTVMIIYAIINAVCAVFMAIVQHLNRRRFAGISFWLADMVLQTIGSILIILRGTVPDFISMTVSNVMIISGIFIIYIGLERFVGKKSFQIHNYILLAIFIVIQVYFTYVRSDLTARDFNISAITLILTFQCAWLMIRRVPKDMRQTTGITGLVFAGYAFISLIRIILLIVFPLKSSDFFKAGAPDTIIIILYIMLAAGLAFSLILMVNGRLVGDIRIYAQQRDNDALKLKERVSEIHNYLDIAEVMILVINNEGKITLINRKGSEILGCKEHKTIGKNWFDEFIPERLREEVKLVFNRMMAGKAKSLEYFENFVITCKGEERLIAWHNVLIKDSEGRITGTLSSGEDITEYKKAEKAQRESAEKFSKAFQTSPYAITITSIKDGKLIEVNDAFTTITGYTCEESVSSSSINLSLWVDRENRERVVSALKEGVEVKDKEFQFRKKNGETIIGLFSAQIIHINNEPFILSSISDITERKRMEEKLLKVMEKYKSSNFELEQYANVASHDLQEPLRVISSYTQLLEKRYKNKLDTNANDFIKYIVDGVNRMQQLINDLLSYSKVSGPDMSLEQTDCNTVLTTVMVNLATAIHKQQVVITKHNLPTVTADRMQLMQLFQNLLDNAIKYRSKNKPRIHISADLKADFWIFSVNDNGIGIDPKYFDRIFDIFQRLHRDEYPGTGIGLAICKKIVERHGGKSWVESKLGKGSTFYFSIPA